jgi:hypothetical protein
VYYRLKIKKKNGSISYSKIISLPLGTALTKVSVAPNPVHDMMNVTINASSNNLMNLYIYDISGKVVRKMQTNLQTGTNVISVNNLSELQSGMYLVIVSTAGETFRQKIVLAQ